MKGSIDDVRVYNRALGEDEIALLFSYDSPDELLVEARIPLAQATVHIATAPKSNRAYTAIDAALADIRNGVTLPVPKHLRDTHYAGSAKLGHGEGYQYSHDFEGGYVPQAYLPEGRVYYTPSENGAERRVKERLDYWRSLFDAAQT